MAHLLAYGNPPDASEPFSFKATLRMGMTFNCRMDMRRSKQY